MLGFLGSTLDNVFITLKLKFKSIYVECWGANLFESCMGAYGNILCRQAISIMATWAACWLVSSNDLSSILFICFWNSFCHFFLSGDCLWLCHSNGGIFWQDYDCLLSSTQATIHSKLVDFQKELVTLQVWHYPVLSIFFHSLHLLLHETSLWFIIFGWAAEHFAIKLLLLVVRVAIESRIFLVLNWMQSLWAWGSYLWSYFSVWHSIFIVYLWFFKLSFTGNI